MKILVVDDEHCFGSLLSRALAKLGHSPEIACHPADALEMFRARSYDAVITDIDMPEMDGVALARAIRDLAHDTPIAFCTGSAPQGSTLAEAERIGRVLPKVWTAADVRELVRGLNAARPSLAQTVPRTGAAPVTSRKPVSDNSSSRRRVPRKIKVTCRDWRQVAGLCDEHAAGRHSITLRGRHKLVRGEKVLIALSLPDELVLSIPGEVHSISRDPVDDARIINIDMVGLTPEIVTRLRSMCQTAGVRGGATYSKRNRRPRGSDSAPADGDGAVLGNLRLRKQIDQLGKKLEN